MNYERGMDVATGQSISIPTISITPDIEEAYETLHEADSYKLAVIFFSFIAKASTHPVDIVVRVYDDEKQLNERPAEAYVNQLIHHSPDLWKCLDDTRSLRLFIMYSPDEEQIGGAETKLWTLAK